MNITDFPTVKLEIFIPEDHVPQLQEALHQAGAGRVGNYDHCMSIMRVRGYWRPLDGSDPYEGEIGALSEGEECKVEVRCPSEKVRDAYDAIRRVHPYDEPVINIVPLLNGFI